MEQRRGVQRRANKSKAKEKKAKKRRAGTKGWEMRSRLELRGEYSRVRA